MKKSFLTLVILLASFSISSAQYIHIEDGNLRQKLKALYPQCVNAQLQLDTTCAAIINAQELNLDYLNLYSIKEIKYFRNLKKLTCAFNQLQSLPNDLPKNLEILSCSYNKLTSVPKFPLFIKEFYCSYNQLTSLKVSGNSLKKLYFAHNQISSLIFPPSNTNIVEIDGSYNKLTTCPIVGPLVKNINFSNNLITSIPTLVSTLKVLTLRNNLITNTPWYFPTELETLDVSGNQISNFNFLPAKLLKLDCSNNTLEFLASLPPTLQDLNCSNNSLTSIAGFPAGLQKLNCSYNDLTFIGNLPTALKELYCGHNDVKTLYIPTPSSLTKLSVEWNNWLTLPYPLPATLTYLKASGNKKSPLPTLPNSIQYLILDSMELTWFHPLPTSLKQLSCIYNRLWTLPTLPPSMYELKATLNCFSTPPVNPNPATLTTFIVGPNRSDCGAIRMDDTESDIETSQTRIYPNPAVNEITINDREEIIACEIWNGNGIKIMETVVVNNKIDISSLRTGIYTLKCMSENRYSVYSFVKE